MRLFANAGPISKVLEKTFEEGDELEHPMLNRSIQTAQKKVEQQNYSIRKRLLQFDDVLNRQREVIYGIRNEAIHSGEPRTIIFEMIREELEERLESFMTPPKGSSAEHELTQFIHWINTQFPINFVKDDLASTKPEVILDTVIEKIQHAYKEKEQLEEAEDLLSLERYIIIATIDGRWQNHLTEMEELRRSVGLRGYGQKDPLNEYKSEAFVYFEQLMQSIREGICIGLFRSATNITKFQHMLARLSASAKANGPGNSPANQAQEKPKQLPQIKAKRVEPKVGRNDPCPCGSGKKFKKCCGVE